MHIAQDGSNSFEIEAKESIIDALEASVDADGVLRIDFSKRVNDSGLYNYLFNSVNYYISMDKISELSLGSSGSMVGDGNPIESKDLNIGLSGSGKIQLDLDVDTLTSRNAGSGHLILSGEATNHDLALAGSGKTSAYDLVAKNTKLRFPDQVARKSMRQKN